MTITVGRPRAGQYRFPNPFAATLLDCDFDRDGTKDYIRHIRAEIRTQGSFGVGQTIRPQFQNYTGAYSYLFDGSRDRAEIEQLAWERERQARRKAEDAIIKAEWDRREKEILDKFAAEEAKQAAAAADEMRRPKKAWAMRLIAELKST